jgi:hypothetical protein
MSNSIIVCWRDRPEEPETVFESDSYDRGTDGFIAIHTHNRDEIGSRETFLIPSSAIWYIKVKR